MLQEPSFWIFASVCAFLYQHQQTRRLAYILQGRMAGHHSLANQMANILSASEPTVQRAQLPLVASLVRYAYRHQSALTVTLLEELDECRRLVEAHHLYQSGQLGWRVNPTSGIDDLNVPPFSLIAVVENALEHGMRHPSPQVSIDIERGKSHFSVSFSGYGLPLPDDLKGQRQGDGLRLLCARLAYLHEHSGNTSRDREYLNIGDALTLTFPI